ncbi:hypothetical protein GCM10009584_19420 [Ornithinimicrobium humiphilum]
MHDDLREQLHTALDAVQQGRVPEPAPRPLDHCIAFCVALHEHHTGEDRSVFPALRDAAPELGDTIDALVQDHSMISWLLQRAATAIERAAAGTDLGAVAAELEGIGAILESHFRYEERTISEALDRLPDAGPLAQALRPGG